MFSKACEYGIRAAILIAIESSENKKTNPKEIAEKINSPKAFTAKILQALVKHEIIKSTRGAQGGFEIEPTKIKTVKLAQIVTAIDGDSIYKGCGLGLETCDENHPCPVHEKFKIVRTELREMLENTTLEQLAIEIKSGTSFLKI